MTVRKITRPKVSLSIHKISILLLQLTLADPNIILEIRKKEKVKRRNHLLR